MTFAFRGREMVLLLFAGVLVLTGASVTALAQSGGLRLTDLSRPLIYLAAALALHLFLSFAGLRSEQLLLPVVAAISGIGLVFVERLDPELLAPRQLVWLLIGLLACLATFLLSRDLNRLRRFKYSIATVGIILLAATIVFGQDLNGSGARLWLSVGTLNFQPSELLKVLLVVFLAAYLDEHALVLSRGAYQLGPLRLPPIPYLIPLFVMWGLAVLVLFVQREHGAALLYFGIFVSMLYLASGRWLYPVVGLLAFGVIGWLSYYVIPIYRGRVDIWLDPWSQSAGLGHQLVQGLIALASGGLFGVGIGLGRPGYVPAVQTDFILAAIGEETGLIGALALLALYAVLLGRGFRIAQRARSSFAALLAGGLTTVLGIQTFVILAGVLRMMPMTGITLPFVSYGGSSILTNFVIVGLLLRVAADTENAG